MRWVANDCTGVWTQFVSWYYKQNCQLHVKMLRYCLYFLWKNMKSWCKTNQETVFLKVHCTNKAWMIVCCTSVIYIWLVYSYCCSVIKQLNFQYCLEKMWTNQLEKNNNQSCIISCFILLPWLKVNILKCIKINC